MVEHLRYVIKYLLENNLMNCDSCSEGFIVDDCDNNSQDVGMVLGDATCKPKVTIWAEPIEEIQTPSELPTDGRSYYPNNAFDTITLKWRVDLRFSHRFDTNCNGELRVQVNELREKLKFHLLQLGFLKDSQSLVKNDVLKFMDECYCCELLTLHVTDVFGSFSDEAKASIGSVVVYFKTIHSQKLRCIIKNELPAFNKILNTNCK